MEWNFHGLVTLVFIGIGAIVLWGKIGREDLTVYGLGELWRVLGLHGRAADIMQLVAFILIGVGVSIAFVHPQSAAQGFTAGLGWTTLLTARKEKGSRSSGTRTEKTKRKKDSST